MSPDGAPLSASLGGDDCIAHYVRFRPLIGFTPYDEIRLFRNDPEVRFRGVIHETVHPDIRAKAARDGLRVTRVSAGIDHVGYEGDMAVKHRRNVPLLRKAVADWPDRVFLHADLGRSLLALGETAEALDHLRIAIDLSCVTDNAKHRRDGADAWLTLIRHQLENDADAALKAADEACALHPDQKALAMARADALIAVGRGEDAIPALEALLATDAEHFFDPLTAYNMRLFRDWPADRLGAIHARAGRYAPAAEHYAKAAAFDPENAEFRHKADLFAGLAKRVSQPA